MAFQLAACDAEGRLNLGAGAVEWLSTHLPSRPIGVLAVVGPQRSGKSSLLNELLGLNAAFQTSASVASCTKGLWARVVAAPDWSPELAGGWLLVLDTEGLGSPDAPSRDPQLFALAAILASVVMYNSFGLIEDVALIRLARLSSVATRALCGANADGASSPRAARSPGAQPELLWVLRDFSYELTDGESGEPITADAYLHNALQVSPGAASKAVTAREALTSTFERRACHTLPRPASDTELQASAELPAAAELDDTWHHAVSRLRGCLGRMLQPKQSHGGALDGASIGWLLGRAISALGSPDAMAEPDDKMWRGVVEAQAERARQLAVASYSAMLSQAVPDEQLPAGRAKIDEAHRHAKAAAPAPRASRYVSQK